MKYDFFLMVIGIGLLSSLTRAETDDSISKRIADVHHEFSIVNAFQSREQFDAFTELELLEDQVKAIRRLVENRRRARCLDVTEITSISGSKKSEEDFVREVKRRETEREKEANKIVSDTLIDVQQRDLGALLIRHFGFDVLTTPFARRVFPVTKKQIGELQGLQFRMNAELVRILAEYKDDPPAMREELENVNELAFVVFDILTIEQLERLYKLKGTLKEGEPLETVVQTIPDRFRGEIVELVREKRRSRPASKQ